MTITRWPPRSIAYRLLPAGTSALAPGRNRQRWILRPGAADRRARLRVWEYEGGALANAP